MEQDKPLAIMPIGQARVPADLETIWATQANQEALAFEAHLLETATSDTFVVHGYCLCCERDTQFLVDLAWGGCKVGTQRQPNWRERMVCPSCQLNNRQRLIATLLKQALQGRTQQSVYLMEQVTPIYAWAQKHCSEHIITGSEYLGPGFTSGTVVKGIRHEDIESLSIDSQSLDLIVSNDVFEHVPSYVAALAECSRVLKPGGTLLATIPFHSNNQYSVVRAKLSDGHIEHVLPPQYHGNPVSKEGSLVYTDFGWDFLDVSKSAGFQDAVIQYYTSIPYGHLGGSMGVFEFTK